ncbi:MAG: hypothetical protein R3234_05260 [Thermoanaerobaculia bacterium]|nr:hypothetical protein [Thermoanaerobaculia bacterium]
MRSPALEPIAKLLPMRLLLPSLLPVVLALAIQPLRAETPRDRSFEVLDYECRTEIGERRVTLFGNGTVRVWDGLEGEMEMELGELSPRERSAYLERLKELSFDEAHTFAAPRARGRWIQECRLTLKLEDGESREFAWGEMDSLPLSLSRLRRIAEEIGQETRPAGYFDLPDDYEPKTGDVLERLDGERFEILGWTADKKGLELQGVDQPLVVYVRPEDLRDRFVALVSRAQP